MPSEVPDAARGSIPQQPSRRRKRFPAGGPYELIEAVELRARWTFDFVETLIHGSSRAADAGRHANRAARCKRRGRPQPAASAVELGATTSSACSLNSPSPDNASILSCAALSLESGSRLTIG
jgi:hypothetical protein